MHDAEKLGAGFYVIFRLLERIGERNDFAELPQKLAIGHWRGAYQGMAWPFKLNPILGARFPDVFHGSPLKGCGSADRE